MHFHVQTWDQPLGFSCEGVTMYAVGVGKAIEDELREIASEPDDKHLYYAEDFNHMGDITDKLQAEICHGSRLQLILSHTYHHLHTFYHYQ